LIQFFLSPSFWGLVPPSQPFPVPFSWSPPVCPQPCTPHPWFFCILLTSNFGGGCKLLIFPSPPPTPSDLLPFSFLFGQKPRWSSPPFRRAVSSSRNQFLAPPQKMTRGAIFFSLVGRYTSFFDFEHFPPPLDTSWPVLPPSNSRSPNQGPPPFFPPPPQRWGPPFLHRFSPFSPSRQNYSPGGVLPFSQAAFFHGAPPIRMFPDPTWSRAYPPTYPVFFFPHQPTFPQKKGQITWLHDGDPFFCPLTHLPPHDHSLH